MDVRLAAVAVVLLSAAIVQCLRMMCDEEDNDQH